MDISSTTGASPESPASRPVPSPDAASATSGSGHTFGQRTGLTLLVLVFVGFISLGLPDGLLGVAWPSIRQTFGLPLDALGVLFLTTVCGYLTASVMSGWVVERIGVGLLLALSALATAISLLTFALTPGWLPIVLAGVLAGLGGGAIDAGLNSYVALAHSPRLLSWLHACFGLGAAAGPAIMLAVLDAGQPWRVGYAIVGTGQLLLGACFLLTRRKWQVASDLTPQPPLLRGEGEQAAGETPTGAMNCAPTGSDPVGAQFIAPPSDVAPGSATVPDASSSLLHRNGEDAGADDRLAAQRSGVGAPHWSPAVWLSILLFLVYTGIETAAGQWAYTLFVEGRGFSAQAAGLSVSAYWAGLAIGRVLAGLVADRVAPAVLTRWSMVGMLVGAALVWLNAAAWLSFAGLVMMGLAAAPVFPSMIGVTPERFGAARAATIIGFQVGAASLGIAGLPALSGVLAARLGLEIIPVLLVVASAGMVALHEAVVRLAPRSA